MEKLLASHLRIGNYVSKTLPGGTPIEYPIDVTDFYWEVESALPDNEYWDMFSGIPLTEDWLVKFGFEYDERNCLYSILVNPIEEEYFKVSGENGSFHPRVCYDNYYPHPYKVITTVHQLQNLYFALTGKELPITT